MKAKIDGGTIDLAQPPKPFLGVENSVFAVGSALNPCQLVSSQPPLIHYISQEVSFLDCLLILSELLLGSLRLMIHLHQSHQNHNHFQQLPYQDHQRAFCHSSHSLHWLLMHAVFSCQLPTK